MRQRHEQRGVHSRAIRPPSGRVGPFVPVAQSGKNEIVVYQPDDTIRLEVRVENETVWLSQSDLAALFGVDRSVVNRHVGNIYRSGELDERATCAKIAQVRPEGGRVVRRLVPHYNLDTIIAVGYRVNSIRATRFRQWATGVLRDYLLRGYAVNDRLDRLERTVEKHGEQIAMFVRAALPPAEGVFFEGQICDAYATALKIVKSARLSIVLVDNWIDESVLTMLGARTPGVSCTVYTKRFTRKLRLDLARYNAQYEPIEIKPYKGAHDRFLILDGTVVYHVGASLKDLGKSLFAFSRLQIPAGDILSKLIQSSTNPTSTSP